MADSFGIPKWKLWLLKAIDKDLYRSVKHHLITRSNTRHWSRPADCSFTPARAGQERTLTFKHSGNAGDIIYALPAIRALAGAGGAHLKLALDVPLGGSPSHPLGGVMLNRSMFDLMTPLLLRQPYLAGVSVFDRTPVDFDLDRFRSVPMAFDRTNISRWYFTLLGITADLSVPWLSVDPNPAFAGCTLLARSFRYRNGNLSHDFLASCPQLVFVGIREEYEDMRQHIPGLAWHPVQDFLELAAAVAACRLFIGNQSLPFALAEGLKVPRILEVDPRCANVMPCGDQGYEAYSQVQLEYLVGKVLADR